MPDITITLTDNEMKALAYVAVDPVEWITNLTRTRAAAAEQEIYESEVMRMMNDPNITTMPATREEVISNADIKSAAERQAEFLAQPPIVELPPPP
jgi:hypothetical protein